MSLKTSNKVDTNRYELEILIDGESFRNAILTVYKREKKNKKSAFAAILLSKILSNYLKTVLIYSDK